MDFNLNEIKRNDLIQAGYDQTIDYFRNVLPNKKTMIKASYECIYVDICKIQKLIESNKIFKAKVQLGDLFMYFCDCKDAIDDVDVAEIQNFKDIFLANIKYPALFGKVGLKNDNLIKAELAKLKNKLEIKIEEFQNYLELYPAK